MGGRKRRKKRNSLKEALGLGSVVRPEALYKQAVLHLNCRGELEAENCRGILSYDQTALVLDMGQVAVKLVGVDLMVDTYHKDLITVHGRIFSLELVYQTKKQR